VDKRTIERFEREAKQLNRESWFLAFIMDTNEVNIMVVMVVVVIVVLVVVVVVVVVLVLVVTLLRWIISPSLPLPPPNRKSVPKAKPSKLVEPILRQKPSVTPSWMHRDIRTMFLI